jgi:hypothetical protein
MPSDERRKYYDIGYASRNIYRIIFRSFEGQNPERLRGRELNLRFDPVATALGSEID